MKKIFKKAMVVNGLCLLCFSSSVAGVFVYHIGENLVGYTDMQEELCIAKEMNQCLISGITSQECMESALSDCK